MFSNFARAFQKIFAALSSLKLAVIVILGLAVSLAVATILESTYDTPTAQYWIYRSTGFHSLLALLGLNIFCVAMSRYPWKKNHIPFLLAHLGILILLAGSWITDRAGIDGSLRVSENETAGVVDLDSAALVIRDATKVYTVPVPWHPPGASFRPISVSARHIPYDLKIDQFISHADPQVSFEATAQGLNQGALHLKLVGGAMKISQDFWLWEGAPSWKTLQMGPAQFAISREGEVQAAQAQPHLTFLPAQDGSLSYVAYSSSGAQVKGKLARNRIKGQSIQPGWKGNPTLVVEEWLPRAAASTHYQPSRIQYGNQAPTSAIHLVTSHSVDVWLGLGDKAVLNLDGKEVEVGYFSRRVVLPFSVRLNRFTVDHDQGTLTPAAYSSQVTVLNGTTEKSTTISMNEPLEVAGYTLYQASYEEGLPRPMTSILAVNQDPGRFWKYLGSALIVLGSILLFAAKYRKSKK